MHLRRLIFIILILCLFVSPVLGIRVTVNPSGGDSDQDVINEAFEKVAQFGGGEVYLEGEDGNNIFTVTGSCVFQSDYTKLTGDSNTILAVSPKSSQWFTGTNSIIYSGGHSNIEISGFQIDGNCEQMPFEYHRSRSDTAHDCERAVIVSGSSSDFCENVSIHDMQIYDCFSDGAHVRFADNVHIYNNFISNCQHEGVFLVSVKNGLTENNKIAGITSDCIRLDNAVNNIVQYNYCYSYIGNHNSKAPKAEQNGIQIADAGSSHGYDASKKPTKTKDVEVRFNTFVNTGDKAVWLDSTGKGYDNVYIHDNTFEDVSEFTNNGESVSITGIDPSKPISYENPPSKETSEFIFTSIFDILNLNFVEHAGNNSVILPEGVSQTQEDITATVTYFQNKTLVSLSSTDGLTSVHVTADGQESVHTILLGEKIGFSVLYTNVSIWEGQHTGDSFSFDGTKEDIKIVCNTPKGSFVPQIVTETKESSGKIFSPWILVYFFLLFTFLGVSFISLWIVFKR